MTTPPEDDPVTDPAEQDGRPGAAPEEDPWEDPAEPVEGTGGEGASELPPSIPPQRPARLADAARPAESRRPRRGSTLVVVLLVLVIAALVKTFVVQTFEIPSGSMEDTLVSGDRVAVTVYDSQDVHRGDIVVFRDPDHWLSVTDPTGLKGIARAVLIAIRLLPEDSGHHLIKRVIGVAGDHIVADGSGTVTVNGVVLDEPYVKDGEASSVTAFDVTVPEGCVWVMGDNRANSADSRYHQSQAYGGAVPMSDVVGVAKAVVWPVTHWTLLDGGEAAFSSVPSAAGPTAVGRSDEAVALPLLTAAAAA